MKRKSALLALGMLMALIFAVGARVQAGEIIYADDIQNHVITTESLEKAADNIIVLVDTSASMSAPAKGLNKSYYELELDALTRGVSRLPDLGYNVGVYRFTPWEVLYPIQKFNQAGVLDALKKLPKTAEGRTTPLLQSLEALESVLKDLKGNTFVYLPSDGGYEPVASLGSPGAMTAALAKKYNVCFQVIDYAEGEKGKATVSDMAKANYCSRAIPFNAYITQPYYGIGPLFYTRWDVKVITTSAKKVEGYKVENINFEVNKFDLSAPEQEELNGVAKFMAEHTNAYTVLFGFSDDTGKREYNMELSRRRSEAVADYLFSKFNLGPDRVVPLWYGEANPIASNTTEEGRAKNRRVEVSIGGL